MKKQASNQHL